MIPDHH